MGRQGGRRRVDAHVRKMLALYGGVLLGAAWLVVALLAQYKEGFVLFGAFQDLGVLFWVVFVALGLALVGTLAWASLGDRDARVQAILAAERGQVAALDPVHRAPGFDPRLAPGQERTTCARCGRTLPVWRMPDGTCTVCAPFSVFLDPPRKGRANAELEARRNRLFILQGLGLGLLALAFASAVVVFPVLKGPERPILATIGFLVFSPLLFGFILLMYAHSEAVPEADT